MLKLSKQKADHEELFLTRYPQLLSWSMQISGQDRDKAEDLVHDAFIQWVLVRPDLDAIRNLDGYLYGMLRNMHSAELRRAFRASSSSLSVVEYDSAVLSLQRASDEAQVAHIQEQLRSVCDYACVRKESSKAGSLLLLRFFHGYYPGESARIAGIRRVTVDSWLRIARAEAKLYLENPEALKFMKDNGRAKPFAPSSTDIDFLDEINERIYRSCNGACLNDKKLKSLYAGEGQALDCESLAHVSSCQECLKRAAKLLELPDKDHRDPPEYLGRDPQPGEKSLIARINKAKRSGPHSLRAMQMQDIVEHRPAELHVAVNGFTVGTQKVISERIEHSLKVNLLETIGLVEVLSEQGVRLLALYVESPPDGALEQSALVHLSDDRRLGVRISFHEHWPTLELNYSDPHFAEVSGDPEAIGARAEVVEVETEPAPPESPLVSLLSQLRALRFDSVWSRRASVMALASLLGALALFLSYRPSSPPAARDILAQAETSEQASLPGPGEVIHRNITFEERKQGVRVAQHKVEIWRANNGMIARRLYDETGALVAGAWQNGPDTPQNVFYHHGSKLKVFPPSHNNAEVVAIDHLWLFDPSAATFNALIRNLPSATVEVKENRYVVKYSQNLPASAADKGVLIEATLVIDRATQRAVSQSLVFQQGDERSEFSFSEVGFERLPQTNVSPRIFQPDPELLLPVDASETSTPAKPVTNKSTLKPPPTAAELAALEVNILYLLDQVNANSGEQIEVRRLPGQELIVEALVETNQRKMQILQALSSVARNPLIRMDVVTLEEALKRASPDKRSPESLGTVVISSDRIPVYAEVRHYFERELAGRAKSGSDIDTEVQRFSGRMIDQSRQALLHAFALKHLVERFSAADVRALNDESRSKWREMIRSHAREFRENSMALRRDLSPVFPHADTNRSSETVSIADDAELMEVVKNLVSFASATDEAISRAFSISPDNRPAGNSPANTIFWRTLSRADALAAALERLP